MFEYCSFTEGHITRDIISIFKTMFYGPWTSWREVDLESRDLMFEEFQDFTYNYIQIYFMLLNHMLVNGQFLNHVFYGMLETMH